MNIVWIIPRIPYPTSDGGATCMFHTLRAFSQQGHAIYICGYESELHIQDRDGLSEFGELLTQPGNFSSYTSWDAIKFSLLRKPLTVFHKYDKQILIDQFEQINIQPDVVFFEGVQVAKHIGIAKKYFPTSKIVIREQNVEYQILGSIAKTSKNLLKRTFYKDQSALLKRFEYRVLALSDLVITITEEDKKTLRSLSDSVDITTITAGTLLPQHLEIPRSKHKVLMISSWKWEPNLFGITWFLSEVWDDLLNIMPHLELHIAGSGLPDHLYSSKRNIIYHGFVEDLEPLKQTSTVFLAPIFSGSGIKIKVLEALSSRIPVVTTPLGASGIQLTDDKDVVLFHNKASLISSITSLINDPQKRTLIGLNGYNHVKENFTWDSIGHQLSNTLQALVDS